MNENYSWVMIKGNRRKSDDFIKIPGIKVHCIRIQSTYVCKIRLDYWQYFYRKSDIAFFANIFNFSSRTTDTRLRPQNWKQKTRSSICFEVGGNALKARSRNLQSNPKLLDLWKVKRSHFEDFLVNRGNLNRPQLKWSVVFQSISSWPGHPTSAKVVSFKKLTESSHIYLSSTTADEGAEQSKKVARKWKMSGIARQGRFVLCWTITGP